MVKPNARAAIIQPLSAAGRPAARRGHGLLVGRRLVDRAAHPQADRSEDAAEQERHAPAPIVHLVRREDGVDDRRDRRAEQQARNHAHLLETAIEAALVLRRPLDDVGGGRTPFAAGREALHQAREHQQQRRRDADRRIGRQHADQHGADRHQRDGDQQRGLAAMGVADAAQNDAAERAGDKAEADRRGRSRAGR